MRVAVKLVMLVKPLSMGIREHLKSDKSSHVYKHLHESPQCKSLCSEDCFSILDTADTKYILKIKEALHMSWIKPDLNKQVKHYKYLCLASTPFLPSLLGVVSSFIFYFLLHIFLIIFNLFIMYIIVLNILMYYLCKFTCI